MNPATSTAIAARLRSTKYANADELAQAIVSAITGVEKNQTARRGLPEGQYVDVNGGTILKVDDQSAARQSVSLQTPQFMTHRKQGAIATRMQRRVDLLTRAVPAVVVAVNGDGAEATLTVVLVGDVPAVSTDDVTGNLIPGDPISGMSSIDTDNRNGTVLTLPMTGTPFAGTGGSDTGTKIPAVGATVMVNMTDQSEKRNTWHRRGTVNFPRVTSIPGASSAALVNGFCCTETGNPPGGT